MEVDSGLEGTSSAVNLPKKLLELPDDVLETILGFLTFDEIAQNRIICKKFDTLCGGMLNRGFKKCIERHTKMYQKIKGLLPRRESQRRSHVLSRHADVLRCLDTRLSMLSLAYTKYIEMGICCFIPGKVIDELQKVLKIIDTSNEQLRVQEVLKELRDVSSMALEHFEEIMNKFKFFQNSEAMSSAASHSVIRHNSRYIFGLSTIASPPPHIEPRLDEVRTEVRPVLSHCLLNNLCGPIKCSKSLLVDMQAKNKKLLRRVGINERHIASQKSKLAKSLEDVKKMKAKYRSLEKRFRDTQASLSEISSNIKQLQFQINGDIKIETTIRPRNPSIYRKRTAAEIVGSHNAHILRKRTRTE